MAQNIISRQRMKEILESGESIGFQGRIIEKLEDLPTEVEVSQADPDQVQALLASKLAEQVANQKIIDGLREIAKAKAESTQVPVGDLKAAEGAEKPAEGAEKDGSDQPKTPSKPAIPPKPLVKETGLGQTVVADKE